MTHINKTSLKINESLKYKLKQENDNLQHHNYTMPQKYKHHRDI